MNWIAVTPDSLPPHGEIVLTYEDNAITTAMCMNGIWYLACQGSVFEHEVYVPCGMGCCGEWKTEEVELEWTPTYWAELPDMPE